MRGKDIPGGKHENALGITPACAGKSAIIRTSLGKCQDHPRVCGEKPGIHLPACCLLGSPPRVRGKAIRADCVGCGRGITPACAGKSLPAAGLGAGGQDHPRVCGEKTAGVVKMKRIEGSPPRVRGKVLAVYPACKLPGITPACAGKRSEHEKCC